MQTDDTAEIEVPPPTFHRRWRAAGAFKSAPPFEAASIDERRPSTPRS